MRRWRFAAIGGGLYNRTIRSCTITQTVVGQSHKPHSYYTPARHSAHGKVPL